MFYLAIIIGFVVPAFVGVDNHFEEASMSAMGILAAIALVGFIVYRIWYARPRPNEDELLRFVNDYYVTRERERMGRG